MVNAARTCTNKPIPPIREGEAPLNLAQRNPSCRIIPAIIARLRIPQSGDGQVSQPKLKSLGFRSKASTGDKRKRKK